MAFASVLYPERCLAVELANPEPIGSSQQGTPRGLRTITELFRPGASTILLPLRHFPAAAAASAAAAAASTSRFFAPRRRGPLAVLPENDRPSMVSAVKAFKQLLAVGGGLVVSGASVGCWGGSRPVRGRVQSRSELPATRPQRSPQ